MLLRKKETWLLKEQRKQELTSRRRKESNQELLGLVLRKRKITYRSKTVVMAEATKEQASWVTFHHFP